MAPSIGGSSLWPQPSAPDRGARDSPRAKRGESLFMEQRIVVRGAARIGTAGDGGRPGRAAARLARPRRQGFRRSRAAVAAAGFRVLCPDPRGIGASVGPMEGLTLYDLAEDAAAVLEAEAGEAGPAIIAGHAFGNWVARALSAARPALVRAVRAAGRFGHHRDRSCGPRLDRWQLRCSAIGGGTARASAARLFRAGARRERLADGLAPTGRPHAAGGDGGDRPALAPRGGPPSDALRRRRRGHHRARCRRWRSCGRRSASGFP